MKLRVQETPRAASLSVEIPNIRGDEDFIQLLDLATSPKELSFLVSNIGKGFKSGHAPVHVGQCIGGTYFLEDQSGKRNGVFKPSDEEPSDVIKGVQGGEASVRECAAFLLDHGHFANVPATDLVVCQHSTFTSSPDEHSRYVEPDFGSTPKLKLGSFQEFREHDGDFDEMSRKSVAEFSVLQVQKIAVLDLRLFNTDRHGGNLLYKLGPSRQKSSAVLIPIDHGFCLPSTLDEAMFVWLDWPQVTSKMEPEVKSYIAKLDVEQDTRLLQEKFPGSFGDEHFRVMRLTAMLLKKGAALDLTLGELGSIVCRLDYSMPSVLEEFVDKVKLNNGGALRLDQVGRLLDEHLAEIAEANREDELVPTTIPCRWPGGSTCKDIPKAVASLTRRVSLIDV
eukprot:TRINITY_DN5264_c0_g1_i1.p1 TRINITY_DN5264_c0_g1~~TRINITY_DN5264_c0_g1_i1.p1  ORF type:complete len:394 (+),score=144.41 TRINITY_DN5264_c0_g1_i1:257-1438(+)